MWQAAKNIYHLGVAVLANIRYGFPGRKLTIIGVTGTDGKTTTTNIIYHILKTAGKNVSMVSTVGATINGKESLLKFHVTTPSAFEIQRFLFEAIKTPGKEKYVVLEVSSHAIDQFRIWGIPFAVGVITNVTNEHLDYHKTYNNYLATKASLLQKATIAIVNKDDTSYKKLSFLLKDKQVITYGMESADVTPRGYSLKSQLVGDFNTYNMLAAVSVAQQLHIKKRDIESAISTFQTPFGRMNEVSNRKGLTILVDYAHTPNGLQQALRALSSKKKKGSKVIALVGAEGKRDPGKREIMGEIAARLADIVVITAVDPRGESEAINKAILQGAEKSGGTLQKTVFIEPNRATAIQFALTQLAKKGDIVALFGKGHERSMNYDGKHEVPWSDTDVVKKVLKI